jgi:hypothetical protein
VKPKITKPEKAEAVTKMRRKVIALLMGWKPEQFGFWDPATFKYLPDMKRIYTWVNEYGMYKPKWLNKHSYPELVNLVSQITKITNPNSRDATKEEKKPRTPQPRDQGDLPPTEV